MEERWAMARWISTYIDENTERWKKEKDERKKDEKTKAEEWKKMNRLEKIRMIKEKQQENKMVIVDIRPAKLKTVDQAEQQSHPEDNPETREQMDFPR